MLSYSRMNSVRVGAVEQESTSSKAIGWLTAAIVVGGIYLVLKTDVSSQGEWNERYGKRKVR